MKQTFQVGEFAELTGVTVRTLHHYDRIGLMSPSQRHENGYRLYGESDLLRLQQVLTLRNLGFKLSEIKNLVRRSDYDVVAAMRLQRFALREQVRRLKRIDEAIEAVLKNWTERREWQWDLVLAASSAVQEDFESKDSQMAKHFTPEQMEQARKLGESLPEGYIEDVQDRWKTLIEEVNTNLDADPASELAQSLLARWNELTAETQKTWQQEPGLWEAVGEGYKSGAFADNPNAPSPAVFEFIQQAQAAK